MLATLVMQITLFLLLRVESGTHLSADVLELRVAYSFFVRSRADLSGVLFALREAGPEQERVPRGTKGPDLRAGGDYEDE